MPGKTAFYYDERCMWHSTGLHALVVPVGGWVQPPAAAGHAESPESKRRIKSLMDVSGLSARIDVCSAAPVSEDDLRRVHPDSYLKKFKQVSDAGGGDLGKLAPFGRGSYEIAKLSTGLVIGAVDSVFAGKHRNAYAMSRPPGHHCLPDLPMGFCVLANVAIAAEVARARHGLERIAVVDWDVHHGNGTQSIFWQDNQVLTVSLHADPAQEYPFFSGYADESGGEMAIGSNINLPLPAGCDDSTYLQAVKVALQRIRTFRPRWLVLSAGYDTCAADPTTSFMLSGDAYEQIGRKITKTGLPVLVVHEGGYAIEENGGLAARLLDGLRSKGGE